MMQQRPVKIPRGLTAYVASQRREEHTRTRSAGSVTARRRELQPQDTATGTEPGYGCVEWYMYECRPA